VGVAGEQDLEAERARVFTGVGGMEWLGDIGGAGQGMPRTEEIFSGGASIRGERFDLVEVDL